MAQVVLGAQHWPQHFVAAVQVAQVGAGETVGAGVAVAAFLDRPQVALVGRVADANGPVGGEKVAVAGVAGGHAAVEHVDSARHRLHQVLGPADAHQVARPVHRQLRSRVLEHCIALVFRLTHGQPADGVPVKIDVDQRRGRAAAQVVVDAALDDAEQCRVVALVGFAAALRPAQAQLHRRPGDRFGGRVRSALVEDHHDVRIEHLLDVHALLGTEEHLAAVDRCGEGHAGFRDLALVRQREHLEAARVGQDRPVPAREAVQAAVVGDDVQPGPQEQVEGVAQDDLRAQGADIVREDALHRSVSPHRHEGRRLHHPARKAQAPAAGRAVGAEQLEVHAAHGATPAACPVAAAGPACGYSSMASP